jgi:O-antigen biosynthesis protein WbqL
MDTGFTTIYEPTGATPNLPLLDFSDRLDEIVKGHDAAPTIGAIGFSVFRDIMISGRSFIRTENEVLPFGELAPHYVDYYVQHDMVGDEPSISSKSARNISDPVAVVSNFNFAVYGHWLLEGMPKLLLLARHAKMLPKYNIALPTATPAFVTGWISLILPGATIEWYNHEREYLDCDTVIVPSFIAPRDYFFHPIMNTLLDDLHPNREDGQSIYLTRTYASAFRSMNNKDEIERIAEDHGLTLIAPETLPIRDQINLFASANVVISEYGSMAHNSIFCQPNTPVFCLNWVNAVQSRIGQLRQQPMAYQLPTSGQPLKYEFGRDDVRGYDIDPKLFVDHLRTLLRTISQSQRSS